MKKLYEGIHKFQESYFKKKERLTLNELMFTLVLSSLVFFAVEIEKLWKRKQVENYKG